MPRQSHVELPSNAPPSAARPTLRASLPAGAPASIFLPRSSLVPGRYRAVLTAPPESRDAPCVGADAALTIDFVAARRKAGPDLVGAVEQVIKDGWGDRQKERRERERETQFFAPPPKKTLTNLLHSIIHTVSPRLLPDRRGLFILDARPPRRGRVRIRLGRVQPVS